MQRMAQFHANGFNRTEEYKANLKSINPNAKDWQEDLDTLFPAFKTVNQQSQVTSAGFRGVLFPAPTEKPFFNPPLLPSSTINSIPPDPQAPAGAIIANKK